MAEYPYSPELKKPLAAGDVDFLDPKTQKTLETVMKIFQFQAKIVTTPSGVRKSWQEYPAENGDRLPYLLSAPKNNTQKLPAIIYYHGGGFMYPIQAMMVKVSCLLAKNCNVRVFLPEYRIAPEYSCKTILEDCYSMLTYVCENADALNVDRDRILVYGDSAGGALAAAVTHMAKDRKGPKIKAQLLIYPVADDQSEKYESIRQYPDAAWSSHANKQMWQIYFSKGDCGMKKYAVPMAYDDLAEMPPAYVEPQEIDVLRDEAIAYANKLKASGVPVEINVIPASYHGFDADVKNPFVKRVLEKRYAVIQDFLAQ